MLGFPGFDRFEGMRATPLFFASAFALVVCVFLGGAAGAGFTTEVVLQYAMIPVLILALWSLRADKITARMRGALIFCLAILVAPLLQLIPLPPAIWTHLPGREALAASYPLINSEAPWAPLSLTPGATWLGLLSCLPPLAVFCSVIQLDLKQRRWLAMVLIALGLLSAFVGLLQFSQGASSPLRLFEYSNPETDETEGFFGNRNHFAALLYCVLAFSAAFTAVAGAFTVDRERRMDIGAVLTFVVNLLAIVVILATVAMARSRAGLVLSALALFGALAMAKREQTMDRSSAPVKLMLGAVALALVFAVQFAFYRVFQRFEGDSIADMRLSVGKTTLDAALSYLPFGSGIGSFVPIYFLHEKPQELLAGAYINRAHNDLLESFLETGIVGPLLAAAFFAWFITRSIKIWRVSRNGLAIDRSLARAATLAIALLLAHSFVDYPLRTPAMMAVFAFACALMFEPANAGQNPRGADAARRGEPRRGEPGREPSREGRGRRRAEGRVTSPSRGDAPYA